MRRLLLATLIVPIALSLGGSANAEQPAGEPGDIYWQFVRSGLLADERVEDALVLLINFETVAENAGVEGSLRYGSLEITQFMEQIDQPEAEAELLLMAAGVGVPAEGVVQARPCRYWTPDDGDMLETRTNAGMALGEVLAKVLFDIGIEADHCEPTPDQGAADILIWEYGQDYSIDEADFHPDADSFLKLQIERQGAIPGGTGGGNDVSPPSTGDGGLK